MSDKVIVTYFLLAILILYMKLGGNDILYNLIHIWIRLYIYILTLVYILCIIYCVYIIIYIHKLNIILYNYVR